MLTAKEMKEKTISNFRSMVFRKIDEAAIEGISFVLLTISVNHQMNVVDLIKNELENLGYGTKIRNSPGFSKLEITW